MFGGQYVGFSQNAGNPAGLDIKMPYQGAGMQNMINAVRGTGATNVVLVAGLQFNSNLTGWYAAKLDPAGQLAASWHPYIASEISENQSAFQNMMANNIPIVITETGDNYGPGITTAPVTSAVVTYAVAPGMSYVAWTWDATGWWSPKGGTNILISDPYGTPSQGYGTYYQAHLRCRASGATNCP